MELALHAGASQGGTRFSEDVELLGTDEAELSRGRSLRRQTSMFRRAQVAAFTPEARLGSVLSTWQPNAVPTLQVRPIPGLDQCIRQLGVCRCRSWLLMQTGPHA